ncbi:MAG: hypothetical protein PHH49_05905 [Candidatus Omnitrophica bacterium]|nr:hypothetical protein [Candidatus Omnitrophota bacterium]MDD5488475.1 hypothetical protein [Candidatus Omnitrophota bacterium]
MANMSERVGFIGGVVGTIIGMSLWIIILGVVVKSPVAIIGAAVFALSCALISLKLYDMRPDRKFAIAGMAVLWLTVVNALAIGYFMQKVPGYANISSCGPGFLAVAQMHFFILIMVVLGTGLILRDIFDKG